MTKQLKLNVNDIVISKSNQLRGDALMNAPVSSIQGISDSAATSLKSALGVSTVAELASHPVVLRAQAAVAAAQAASSPGQAAFYTQLAANVQSSLGASLQGTFSPVSYPSGFPVCTKGQSGNFYSLNSLQALDSLLEPANDILLKFEPQNFSTFYSQILSQVTWQLSKDDARILNSPAVGQAQQQVWAAVAQDQVPVAQNAGWPALVTWVFSNYGSGLPQNNQGLSQAAINMNLAYPNTSSALTTYVNTQGPASAIQVAQSTGLQELAAARTNATQPGAANGGLQTSASSYYVGYTVPVWANLTAGLGNTANQVSIGCTASSFSATSTNLTIANASYSVSPGWFTFTASGSASAVNVETYASEQSTMTLNIVYPGVTTFGTDVQALSANLATGWFDNTILTQIIQTWQNPNLTGFAIGESTTYQPPTTFGQGKQFGHLKQWVISNPPTISFTITNANVAAMSAAFQQGSAYTSIGIFSGSAGVQTSGYTVSNFQAVGSTVTVTLAATPVANLPPTQQVAFVLGGVASYPPNNV